MKYTPQPEQPSLYDDYVMQQLVPADHPLVQIDAEVDFTFVRGLVEDLYDPGVGREALDPALLLKLCFLESYYGLSDREVMDRSQTDLACRKFLHLRVHDGVPDPSMMTVFRRRLGQERFEAVFNRSVGMAVERGLVDGRLMIVDSLGIVADVAIPRLRKLLMRLVRHGLLAMRELGLETEALERERQALAEDTSWTQGKQLQEKDLKAWFVLTQRAHDALAAAAVEGVAAERRDKVAALLAKGLERESRPKAGQRRDGLASDVDDDARWSMRERGKKPFVGYKEQMATDAANEIITAATVTPANVDDTECFAGLVAEHEQNTGQKPKAAVADSGYSSGPNRRKLGQEQIADFIAVPTPKGHKQGKFSASDFAVEADGEGTPLRVTCPNGEVAEGGKWDEKEEGWSFYFTKQQCEACPLREQCSKAKRGRTVFVSLYHREFADARARKDGQEFVSTQVERLGIERTFAYKQRRCRHKRARYRGLNRVAIQVFMSCFMVNVVRITRGGSRAGGKVGGGVIGQSPGRESA